MATNASLISEKSASTALLLCLFLGAFGAHRFYVGKIGTGILMLITLGGLGIWTLVDLITISSVRFTDVHGRYLEFTRYEGSMTGRIIKIIGLVLCGLVIFVSLIVMLVMCLTSGMVSVAKDQLQAIHSGDFAKAYTYSSKGFKEATSLEDFKATMERFPAIIHYQDVSFTNRAFKNNDGQLDGVVSGTDGSSASVHYDLVYENNSWKIVNMQIDELKKPGGAAVEQVDHQETQDNNEDAE